MFLADITELQQPSALIYSIQSTATGLCINCTFLDNSTNDCVAVVHQQISQLNSSGLMNIESSHKFIRSGDTASGCIEGVNLEQYQVGVIGGYEEIMGNASCMHVRYFRQCHSMYHIITSPSSSPRPTHTPSRVSLPLPHYLFRWSIATA